MSFHFLESLPRVSFATGQVIIAEGNALQGLFFLESGEVEVLKNGVLIAEVFEAGAVFGEMSWLLTALPMATVRAITPCVCRHVADPAEFFRRNPDATLHVAVTLARRVDALGRYLVEIKSQFRDRADHLGIIDQVLDSLMHKHPRAIPRRATGD